MTNMVYRGEFGLRLCALLLATLLSQIRAQLPTIGGAQVKITSEPFQVTTAQHLGQIVWNKLGHRAQEKIYCVSESPVSQLRFICTDCAQRNITDMHNVLNSAEDQTRTAGFPTVALLNVDAQPHWSGATIFCQAALNGGTIDSPPSIVDVRYLHKGHVVDQSGQGPVQTEQGNYFYVECMRVGGNDGNGPCQQSVKRKTLHCSVASNPPATVYRWLKNGQPLSGNGQEVTIGTEMIGQALQCSANNGLYSDGNWPTSDAVYIHSYHPARLTGDNFQQLQTGFTGNKLDMNQRVSLVCNVEGNPRPIVFWRLKRNSGQVVDAACPQGQYGQYKEQQPAFGSQLTQQNSQASLVRLAAICDLQVSNYSFSGSYWCSACSYVSQGYPECAPSLESPSEQSLTVQVQGPPMQSETYPTVEYLEDQKTAIIHVHYCSEPAPRPPREVLFSVDSNDVPPGQRWDNFIFESTAQNNTVPNCYVARLRITPVRDYDQERQVTLKLQNQFGSKHITVSLADLLGHSNSSIGGVSSWLIILLAVSAAGLLLAVGVILCHRWNLLCFEHNKGPGSQYSNDKLKNGAPDSFIDDGLFAGGVGGERPTHFSSHESLNYAEMHLTDKTLVVKHPQSVASAIGHNARSRTALSQQLSRILRHSAV